MVLVHPPREESDRYYNARALDYARAYASIYKASRVSTSAAAAFSANAAVLLLVAPDTDALCAARILARLLTEDEIPHRIVPVDGYATLQQIMEADVVDNEGLHTLIFLNLGSVLSLSNYFTDPARRRGRGRTSASPFGGADSVNEDDEDEEDAGGFPLPSRCSVHVLDSHRPWNLDNLFATSDMMDRIFVWDDGDVVEKLEAEAHAYERLEFDWGIDSDDDESDDDSEASDDRSDEDGQSEDDASGSEGEGSADEDGERRSKRRKKRRRLGSAGGDEQNSTSSSPARRKRKGKEVDRPRKMSGSERERLQNILNRYYHKGTTMGLSVAAMIYLLVDKLGRSDNDALWLTILGLTSQYTSSQIPYDVYDQQAESLASDVIATNPLPEKGTATNPDDSSIRVVEQELRFTLYRHWSLENAMFHTAYVAAKLNIWKEAGLSKLRGLLAKMGFSLANCRETYEHMALDLRRTLVERMEKIAPEYGMTELVYRSFVRHFGFRAAPLSAADAVEGVSALLQAAYGVRLEIDTPGMTFAAAAVNGAGGGAAEQRFGSVPGQLHSSDLFGSRRVWNLGGAGADAPPSKPPGAAAGAGAGPAGKENRPPGAPRTGAQAAEDERARAAEEAAELQRTTRRRDLWVKNFFTAYSALDTSKPESIELLQASLSLSKGLHRAVIACGISLIEKQAIRTLRSFRLVVLKDVPDLALFAHPAMLTRLALWLIDALRDSIVEHESTRAAAKRARKRQREKAKKAAKGKAKAIEGGGDAPGAQEEESMEPTPEDVPHSMPFVVAALDVPSNTYLVVGVSGATDFGDVRKNKFGLAFQEAAEKSGARTEHDRFETTVVEVAAQHFTNFIEALHVEART